MMTPGIVVPSINPITPHCEHFLIGRGSAFSFLTSYCMTLQGRLPGG